MSQLKFQWDWQNDGNYDTGESNVRTAQRQFAADGSYEIKLLAKDLDGNTATTTRFVTVGAGSGAGSGGGGGTGGSLPTPCFYVNPNPAGFSQEVHLNASCASDSETAAANLEVRWDWQGDGLFDTGFTSVKIGYHTYSPGNYQPVLEVKDATGRTARTSQLLEVLSTEVRVWYTPWMVGNGSYNGQDYEAVVRYSSEEYREAAGGSWTEQSFEAYMFSNKNALETISYFGHEDRDGNYSDSWTRTDFKKNAKYSSATRVAGYDHYVATDNSVQSISRVAPTTGNYYTWFTVESGCNVNHRPCTSSDRNPTTSRYMMLVPSEPKHAVDGPGPTGVGQQNPDYDGNTPNDGDGLRWDIYTHFHVMTYDETPHGHYFSKSGKSTHESVMFKQHLFDVDDTRLKDAGHSADTAKDILDLLEAALVALVGCN